MNGINNLVNPVQHPINPLVVNEAPIVEPATRNLLQFITDIALVCLKAIAIYALNVATLGLLVLKRDSKIILMQESLNIYNQKKQELDPHARAVDNLVLKETEDKVEFASVCKTANETLNTATIVCALALIFEERATIYHGLMQNISFLFTNIITLGLHGAVRYAKQSAVLSNLEERMNISKPAYLALNENTLAKIVTRRQEIVDYTNAYSNNLKNKLLSSERKTNPSFLQSEKDAEFLDKELKYSKERIILAETELAQLNKKKEAITADPVKALLGPVPSPFADIFMLDVSDPKEIVGNTFIDNTEHNIRYGNANSASKLYQAACKHVVDTLRTEEINGTVKKFSSASLNEDTADTICNLIIYDLIKGASLETLETGKIRLNINPYMSVVDSDPITVMSVVNEGKKFIPSIEMINFNVDDWTPYGTHKDVYPVSIKLMINRLEKNDPEILLTLLYGQFKARSKKNADNPDLIYAIVKEIKALATSLQPKIIDIIENETGKKLVKKVDMDTVE